MQNEVLDFSRAYGNTEPNSRTGTPPNESGSKFCFRTVLWLHRRASSKYSIGDLCTRLSIAVIRSTDLQKLGPEEMQVGPGDFASRAPDKNACIFSTPQSRGVYTNKKTYGGRHQEVRTASVYYGFTQL